METDNFLERLQKDKFLDFYLVSLISSDTLLTVEDCEKSLKKILELKELIKTANIDDKERYEKFINDGEKIILRDMEMLKGEETSADD
ncbi:MAG: hypothetical protein IKT40_08835 [Bacilli bacterium]|nr:hypothetical protein [Bacilli bacterium]